MLTLQQVERNRKAYQEIRTALLKSLSDSTKPGVVRQLHASLPERWEQCLHLALIAPALLDSLDAAQSIIQRFVLPEADVSDPEMSEEEAAVYQEAFRVVGQSQYLISEATSRQGTETKGIS